MNAAAGSRTPPLPTASGHWPGRLVAWLDGRTETLEDSRYLNANLMRLIVRGRTLAAVAAFGLVASASILTGVAVSFAEIAAILFTLGAASAFGLHRTRSGSLVTEGDLLLQIAIDIVVLYGSLHLVAGFETPLDHLYFLPVVLGAYALRGWRIGLVIAMILGAWTLGHDEQHHVAVELPKSIEVGSHLAIGVLLGYLAYAVACLSRRHERRLAGNRERQIGQLGAEATSALAARTAHDLSTPLGTMAVLVDDLRQGRMDEAERREALEMLAGEIARCKRHLSGLVESAGVARGDGGYQDTVPQILREIREVCLIRHPEGTVQVTWPEGAADPPEVVMESSLVGAIAGIAMDLLREPPHAAMLGAEWDAAGVTLRIGTLGAGHPLPPSLAHDRLAAASSIVDRHGGRLFLGQRAGEAIGIWLPCAPASADR